MRKPCCSLAGLLATILAVAAVLPAPSFADTTATTSTGSICAVLMDNTGKRIEISNVGTAPRILCQARELEERRGVCDEAFSVCANGGFAAGAQGLTGYNLVPGNPSAPAAFDPEDLFDPQLNPSGLCIPFVQTVTVNPSTGKTTVVRTNLEPRRNPLPDGTLILDPATGAPIYSTDDPNANGTIEEDEPLPSGTLVQVAIDNKPAKGSCLGVRTTFQFLVGTCRLCKVRKIYNTCKSNQKITQIREFEKPCDCRNFSAGPGTRKFNTALAFSPATFELITLTSLDNLGITPGTAKKPYLPSGAGSVSVGVPFTEDFCKCPVTSRFTPDRVKSCDLANNNVDENGDGTKDDPDEVHRWLEVFLSYLPGGVTLKPGMEKLVTFCVSID